MAGDNEPRTKPLERNLLLAAFFRDRRGQWVELKEVGEELAEYSGPVTDGLRKKFWRDLGDLHREAGIEIEWNDQEQAYRIKPPFFTRDERAALLKAARAVWVSGPRDEAPADELGQSLDDRDANVAVRVPAIVRELQPGVADRRLVRFRYKGTLRTVEPYRIGSWRTSWYLLAHEEGFDRRKRFRLDRIEVGDPTIERIGEPGAFTVPDGLDWATEFCLDPNEWGPDPVVTATIETDVDHQGMIERTFDGATTTIEPDGRVLIEVEVRHYVSFVIRALRFGNHARVTGPPELVTMVRDWLAPQTEVG